MKKYDFTVTDLFKFFIWDLLDRISNLIVLRGSTSSPVKEEINLLENLAYLFIWGIYDIYCGESIYEDVDSYLIDRFRDLFLHPLGIENTQAKIERYLNKTVY